MCGIAGVLYFDRERAVDPRLLDRMTDVLAHRGPDGRGTHLDGSLGLGHRRLAIIDLSDDAAQPMPNEDGSVWVVCNGEIYNFPQLRDELRAKGHTFKSGSDTEVLVHLYEEEGDALVDRLRGMYAFALWDARQRRLLVARDRFGQKPLYYRLDHEALWFGSEIKAILEDPSVPRRPDPASIHDYLTYGYVPAPATGFEGIHKLPPGHLLTVEQDGTHAVRRYWQLPMTPKRPEPTSDAERRALREELLAHLDEAVRLRLVSDVPLGAFLSGGVDSSAIVASMCQARAPQDVRTFSIGFAQKAWDETPFARQVATHLGTNHTELQLSPDAMADLERIAWHYGDPFADSSCLPTFAVSRLAREHVTVALSGDGGDELFAGYRRYQGTRLEELVRGSSGPVRAAARSRLLLAALRRVPHPKAQELWNQLAHNRDCANMGMADVYMTRVEYLPPWLKTKIYSPDFRAETAGRDARQRICSRVAASDGVTFLERCAHAEVETYLADDILVKVDVASMAVGLECRAPLLDHVLAEFVGRLPFSEKMQGLETKVGLKEAHRARLPHAVLDRKKMGFGVPLDHWFRRDLNAFWEETILAPRALERGYFHESTIRGLIDDHVAGRHDYQYMLWSLLMLEMWHRVAIDPPANAPPPVPAAAGLA